MRKTLMAVFVVMFFAGNVLSDETKTVQLGEQKERDVFDLGRLVITPSRLYQEYGQVARATDLITEEEIEDKNPMRVSDILTALPSALVQDNGSLGQLSSVRFRGATSSQTLILIDDMPINNQRDGVVNLANYGTDDIERIEVVRGPSSSLYGSGAVGGTVNIITKEGKEEVPKTTIAGRFGTFYTNNYDITNGAKIGKFNYFLTAANDNTKGSRDNSNYHAETYTAKVGYEFTKQHNISVNTRYYRDEVGTPGPVTAPDNDDKQETHQNYINALWNSNFDDKLHIKLQAYQNLDRLEFIENVYPDLDKVTHQTKNRSALLQTSYVLFNNYTIMAGIEGSKYLLNSSSSGKRDFIVRSAYGLLDLKFFDILNVIGGVRIDDYTTFGSELSPNINGVLTIGKHKIRALYAESYRAPTFNDLYWPDDGMYSKGNPNLAPETGQTYEVGIDNIIDFNLSDKIPLKIKGGATCFRTDMKDLILWAEDPSDGINYWKPSNVNKARIDGLELESEAVVFNNIKGMVNYTFTKAKDKDTKKYLVYTPKHKFDFSAQYDHPSGIITRFRGQYVGNVFSDTTNNSKVKHYWIFGTDCYYDIDDHTRYFINIDNLFNRTYEKNKGYPMPGFTIMTGAKVKF